MCFYHLELPLSNFVAQVTVQYINVNNTYIGYIKLCVRIIYLIYIDYLSDVVNA
jgi:hypothetical protein